MRCLVMGKGGEATEMSLWTIVEIILTIMLITALFLYVNNIRTGNYFKEKYLVRDIALMTDLIQSIPGDLSYSYDLEGVSADKFRYVFRDNAVSIGADENRMSGYPYYDNLMINNEYSSFDSPERISFVKKGANLYITDDAASSLMQRYCPKSDGKFSFDEGVLIIAYADERAKKIADSIGAAGYPVADAASVASAGHEKKGFAVVLISTEDADEQSVAVRYLKQDTNTVSFACNIYNNLLLTGGFQVSIMPGLVSKTIPDDVVESNDIVVEIAVMVPDTGDIPADAIQSAVYRGVDSFDAAR